jgi:WD40 repeat protein
MNHNEFVTGSHDKTIKIWDVSSAKCVKTLTGNNEGIWCVNYNPNG